MPFRDLEKKKQYQRQYTKNKMAEDSIGFRTKHKLHMRKYRSSDKYKSNWLKSTYNITLDEYKKLLDETKGVCPLCGITLTFNCDRATDNAVIDHDHKTGRVRGILCGKCNIALGCFKDNIETLEKAIQWLNTK